MIQLIPKFFTISDQVVFQPYFQGNQVTDSHTPDLIHSPEAVKDRMLTQDNSFLTVMIQLFVDRLVIKIVFNYFTGCFKCFFQAISFEQPGMGSGIVVICCNLVGNQDLKFRGAGRISQKWKIIPYLKGRDASKVYSLYSWGSWGVSGGVTGCISGAGSSFFTGGAFFSGVFGGLAFFSAFFFG